MTVKFESENTLLRVWLLLHRVRDAFFLCEDSVFADYGLTTEQFTLLAAVKGAGGSLRPSDLALYARLGDVVATGPRAVFPLRLQHAENYGEPGLALVGDAAHAIHPLAGQGVNLGLLDAATLADVLAQARMRGRPLGAMATLRRYERARKGANLAMMGALDLFKRLFSNDNAALSVARNLGLRAADIATPVKHAIMRRAL